MSADSILPPLARRTRSTAPPLLRGGWDCEEGARAGGEGRRARHPLGAWPAVRAGRAWNVGCGAATRKPRSGPWSLRENRHLSGQPRPIFGLALLEGRRKMSQSCGLSRSSPGSEGRVDRIETLCWPALASPVVFGLVPCDRQTLSRGLGHRCSGRALGPALPEGE